jgi:hypothetical protein
MIKVMFQISVRTSTTNIWFMGYKETAHVYESDLLGSEAVSLDLWFPTLQTNVAPSLARVKQALFFLAAGPLKMQAHSVTSQKT